MNTSMKFKVITLISATTIIFSACANDKNEVPTITAKNLEFKDSKAKINADRIYETIKLLSNKDNSRITGSEGESKTGEYIRKQFEEIGLTVEEQSFPIKSFIVNKEEIVLKSNQDRKIKGEIYAFSGSTAKDGLSSEVVYLDLATDQDLSNINVDGKIALVKAGENFTGEKSRQIVRVRDKGAAAIVFYDPNIKAPISGNANIFAEINIPVVRISNADAEDIIKKLQNKEKIVMGLNLEVDVKESTSKNIIGKIKTSDKANAKTVVIGGHYDGVDTPAANDNASGICSVLEIARVLSKEKLNVNLAFIGFGAEEIGLVGSKAYVHNLPTEELLQISAMVNLDMVGVGDSLSVYTTGVNRKSNVADLSMKALEKFNLKGARSTSSRSDHAPFEEVGIPAVFYLYEGDKNYHTDEDSIEKIDKNNLLNACNIAISVVTALSDSID